MNSHFIFIVLLLLNSVCYSMILPITRFPDQVIFDKYDPKRYYFNKEISIDICIGSQQYKTKVLLFTHTSGLLWINPYKKSNLKILDFEYKKSTTYYFLGAGKTKMIFDIECSGYVSQDTIRLYPIENEVSNIIELNKFDLMIEKDPLSFYTNEAISGILDLSYEELSLFKNKRSDFISQLYDQKIINERLFGIDDKYLYLGEIPFNKKEYEMCIIHFTLPFQFWSCELHNTNLTPLSKPMIIIFDIGFLYIRVTEDHFKEIVNKYFYDLINIQHKCNVIHIPEQVDYIECDKDIQVDKLKLFTFEFEGGLKIELKFKELLLENKNNNKLVFGIIYKKKVVSLFNKNNYIEEFNYVWVFGDIVFRYYSVYFDHDINMIGLKRIYSLNQSELDIEILIMFKLNLFILIIGVLFISFVKCNILLVRK